MKWISSAGGPLVLLPEAKLQCWHGCKRLNVLSSGAADETDYDQACAVSDYLGIIHVHGVEGLVLGDEPLQTTWLASVTGGGMFVRWRFANNESSVIDRIQSIPFDDFQPAGFDLQIDTRKLSLFDSAMAGEDLAMDDVLTIEQTPGVYSIDTLLWEPDNDTGLVIHRLLRK